MNTPTAHILTQAAAALRLLDRPRSRHDLAAQLGISHSSAMRLVAALVALGWVRPVATPRGGRGVRATFIATVRLQPR